MTTPNQITLHDLIIHKLDHINFAEPVLSDLKSEISEQVHIYLRQQIQLNRSHEFARNAVFTDGPEDKPDFKELCDTLLQDSEQFISQSREIAKHLFASIDNDRRIHPGDLVACTFSEGRATSTRWLALLKMDPHDSFVTEEESVGGKRRLILRWVKDVMPVGELQKCAFILPRSLRNKRQDLIVLDQQQAAYGARRMVASFFSKDFLQCEVGLSQNDMTREFISTSFNWIDSKKGIWPEQLMEKFKSAMKAALSQTTVRAVTFAQDAIPKAEEQEQYIATLRAAGLDLTFRPSVAVISKPQIMQFNGDQNLLIRIDREAVGPGKMLEYKHNKATKLWTITIKSPNLVWSNR